MSFLMNTIDLGKKHPMLVNGRAVYAVVTAKVYFDDSYRIEDECFDNEVDKVRHLKKLKDGEITPTVILVEANALRCEGSDSLASAIVSCNEDVSRHISQHGMIENALDALKTDILDHLNLLKAVA
jgi:hypothetical protein